MRSNKTPFEKAVEVLQIDQYIEHVRSVIKGLEGLTADSNTPVQEAIVILHQDINRALDYRVGAIARLYA